MSRTININPLFETPKKPIKERLDEGIFTTLIAGIAGFLLGKRTGLKIAGTKQNVDKFNKALTNLKKTVAPADPDFASKMAKKYNVKIVKK